MLLRRAPAAMAWEHAPCSSLSSSTPRAASAGARSAAEPLNRTSWVVPLPYQKSCCTARQFLIVEVDPAGLRREQRRADALAHARPG
eukprot:1906345-Pleurochrysis_carterae.AAC.1